MFLQGLTLFLGIFEFFAAYKYLNEGAESFEFSAHFLTDPHAKYLYVMFILTLGLQRLTFATSDRGFFPWLCLVVTHVIESIFWWKLAFINNIIGDQPIDAFLMDVVTFKHGHSHYFILLVLVPSFVVMFLLAGWEKTKPAGQKRD